MNTPLNLDDDGCLDCIVNELGKSSSLLDGQIARLIQMRASVPRGFDLATLGAVTPDWESRVIAAAEICQMQGDRCANGG